MTAPTRRTVLAGLSAAGLTVPTLTALPTVVGTHPDADLIELGRQRREVKEVINRLAEQHDALVKWHGEIKDAIAATPAHTAEGLAIRLNVYVANAKISIDPKDQDETERLLLAIAEDVKRLRGAS